jgi:poly(3-hydroxybutyrate) depolymerase
LKTKYDQYLQTWYEFLPKDVLDGTAAKGSVPVILALHGTGDDPLMFVDEIGLLEVAGREKVAVIAPFEEELVIVHEGARVTMGVPVSEGILVKALPRLIDHVLKKYPALDASRVYATGYSLGGGSTLRAIYGGKEKLAAAVPMAGMHDDLVYSSTPEEDARLREIGMPVMILTSTFDLGFNQEEGRLTDNTLKQLRNFARVNRIQLADVGDFSANPIIGYSADRMDVTTLAGEWRNFLWSFKNDKGMPILSMSCTENLTHALYPNYGEIAWNFMRHFARESKTGKLLYTPQ